MTGIITSIYIGVAAVLFWAASTDMKNRRIPNIQPLIVLGLFAALVTARLIDGDNVKTALLWPLFAGTLVFICCTILFALNLMGGGDVKLMAATACIAGPALNLSFLFIVAVAGGLIALAMVLYKWVIARDDNLPKVPYGVAIMAGGVWMCFQKIAIASA